MNRLVLLALLLSLAGHVAAQDLSPPKQTALDETEALSPEIRAMAMSLWTYSETALFETQSAELLAGILEEEGFTVEHGVAGMPTASGVCPRGLPTKARRWKKRQSERSRRRPVSMSRSWTRSESSSIGSCEDRCVFTSGCTTISWRRSAVTRRGMTTSMIGSSGGPLRMP